MKYLYFQFLDNQDLNLSLFSAIKRKLSPANRPMGQAQLTL